MTVEESGVTQHTDSPSESHRTRPVFSCDSFCKTTMYYHYHGSLICISSDSYIILSTPCFLHCTFSPALRPATFSPSASPDMSGQTARSNGWSELFDSFLLLQVYSSPEKPAEVHRIIVQSTAPGKGNKSYRSRR